MVRKARLRVPLASEEEMGEVALVETRKFTWRMVREVRRGDGDSCLHSSIHPH
jgi:hypothetical protein